MNLSTRQARVNSDLSELKLFSLYQTNSYNSPTEIIQLYNIHDLIAENPN